jgi:hypothetical protein
MTSTERGILWIMFAVQVCRGILDGIALWKGHP